MRRMTEPEAPRAIRRRRTAATRIGSLAALVVVVLCSCRSRISVPEIRLQSVSLRSAEETVIGLAIFNPNRFPLRVLSVNYEVSVGEKVCGRGRREEPLFIDARDSTDAEFSLSPDWSRAGEVVPLLLSDTVVFGVKGSYTISTVFGRRRFVFEGRRTVSVKGEVDSLIQSLFGS